jgi:transcriptional regulator with XRE-family HTH domain
MLHAHKPLPVGYPREVKTIGDHIKKMRLDRGLTKSQVAGLLGVTCHAVSDWEANLVSPAVKLIPKVIDFLGYAPFGDITTMSESDRIRACRKLLGLTLRQAADQLNVCPATLSSWERGKRVSRKEHREALESFRVPSSG